MTSSTPASARRRGRTAAVLTACVLALGSLAGPSAPAQAQTADHAHVAATRPTIVLVHGAFADATGWTQEVTLLRKAGYPVIAPANPLRGLSADSDYLRSVLATIDGPVVLVGHSYGGAVITNAARGADNVVALVYVAAFIPAEGTSVATSYDQATYPGSLLTQESLVVRPVANPAAPQGQDADLYIRPDLFRKIFAGDQDRQHRRRHGGHPASAVGLRVHRAVRRTGVEDAPELGPA